MGVMNLVAFLVMGVTVGALVSPFAIRFVENP